MTIELRRSGDLQRISRELRRMDSPEVKKRFRKELRAAAAPLVPRVRSALLQTHTAGPIAALEAAFESGQFARAHRTLFVTVGAGLAVDVALYVAAA